MKIEKDFEIIGLALKYKDNLIISDLHIGIEESLNKRGILIPRFQFEEIIKNLDNIFSKVKVKRIIINGDLKHEFGEISDQEWRNILKLIDYLLEKGEVVIVKGNHDIMLGNVVKKRKLSVVKLFTIDDVAFLHGDEILDEIKDKKVLVIGNEHPAISIRDKVRVEKYKCFLKGKWKDKSFLGKSSQKTLIVMPSFNFFTEGTDILEGEFLSPFLKQDISNFEVYVSADKVYRFGNVKDIRE